MFVSSGAPRSHLPMQAGVARAGDALSQIPVQPLDRFFPNRMSSRSVWWRMVAYGVFPLKGKIW